MIEYIKYNGFDHPVRNVFLRTFGEVFISTTHLNNALVDSNGAYRSEEAVLVDKSICYFVDPDIIFMDENKLRHIIERELDVESEMVS